MSIKSLVSLRYVANDPGISNQMRAACGLPEKSPSDQEKAEEADTERGKSKDF
jgi:hypothetical protein